jgi:hypothetical protein
MSAYNTNRMNRPSRVVFMREDAPMGDKVDTYMVNQLALQLKEEIDVIPFNERSMGMKEMYTAVRNYIAENNLDK